jgi:hypothetical protein
MCTTGYLNRPDLTAASFDADGFYHTGDIGVMPDKEHVVVIDRVKVRLFLHLNLITIMLEYLFKVQYYICRPFSSFRMENGSPLSDWKEFTLENAVLFARYLFTVSLLDSL